MTRPIVAVTTTAACLLFSACDPCASTFSCGQAPRVAVTSQVLYRGSGQPVRGARIEMRRDSGIALLSAMGHTSTNDAGDFVLEMLATEVGPTVVTLTIAVPGEQSYRIRSLRTRATIVTGESTVLKPITSSHPVIPWVIELYQNGTDARVGNALVEFRRTGGVRMFLDGVEVTQVSDTTDNVGWAFPFFGLTADDAGDLVGELVVRTAPLDSTVFTGFTITAVPWYSPSNGLYRVGIGPS